MEGLEFLLAISFFTWCGIFIGYQYCKWHLSKNNNTDKSIEQMFDKITALKAEK